MNKIDNNKKYDDPLMDRVAGKGPLANEPANRKSEAAKSYWGTVVGIVFTIALVVLGYYLYLSQEQLKSLSNRLESSQDQLGTVTNQLKSSESRIDELQTGLSESESQIDSQEEQLTRYQSLYTNLRTNQAVQRKELAAMSIRKADQAEVGALKNELNQTAAGLKEDVSVVSSRIDQTDGNLSKLQKVADSNRAGISSNSDSLTSLRSTVDGNTKEINGVKRSLDRDYYNFELQRGAGSTEVFNIALTLKNTNLKRQRYHVEIITNGRKINKKRVNVNEPIFFYTEGVKKPYEILVSRIGKKFVAGYLSVPKP